ncbi:MAG TPA: phosphatase PAP2 family protein [Xanthobacteraceae bacterium]|nr:phosphatase PAP2 family protein [Xanthobacteraceae bacterium]
MSLDSCPPPVIDPTQRLLRKAAEPVAFAAPAALPRSSMTGCQGSLLLTTLAYVAALGGAAFLNVETPILEGVPLYLMAAGFLCFWGHAIFPRFHRTVLIVEGACIVFALGLSLACLSYLGPITDLPLRDTEMIWIDQHLGFDWVQIMRGFDHQRFLLATMDGAYATFTAQLIGTVLVLIAFRRTSELDRFFVTFICASILAELASVLAPTLGPMLTIAQNDNFLHLSTLGRTTGQIVLALRNGNLRVIDLNAIDGIISFPSLHAAVAVIVPYTLRWNKPLFWPILVLNCVMLGSAIPSGNHYLSDVLGGIVVAVLAILCEGRARQLADVILKQRTPASALS